MMTDNNHFP